jgi:hypothetical protein
MDAGWNIVAGIEPSVAAAAAARGSPAENYFRKIVDIVKTRD